MIIKQIFSLFRTEKRPSHAPTKAYDEQQKMIADRVLLTVLKGHSKTDAVQSG
jgi:hypothetical protein